MCRVRLENDINCVVIYFFKKKNNTRCTYTFLLYKLTRSVMRNVCVMGWASMITINNTNKGMKMRATILTCKEPCFWCWVLLVVAVLAGSTRGQKRNQEGRKSREPTGQFPLQFAFPLPCRKVKETEKTFRWFVLHSSHGDGTAGTAGLLRASSLLQPFLLTVAGWWVVIWEPSCVVQLSAHLPTDPRPS